MKGRDKATTIRRRMARNYAKLLRELAAMDRALDTCARDCK
jgi:hypothetical protein